MPLQIRRGTTAQRLAITPIPGELIYDTTTGQIFVGDGTTAGGATTTGISIEDAEDAAAGLLTSGDHAGISFTYNDTARRIDATIGTIDTDRVTISNTTESIGLNFRRYIGTLGADTITPEGTTLGDIHFYGQTGVGDSTLGGEAAYIQGFVNGTPANSFVPGGIDFHVQQSNGVDNPMLRLLGGQRYIVLNEAVRHNSDEVCTDGIQYMLRQHHSTADANNFSFYRGRGTTNSPEAIQNGDDIIDIAFGGWTGFTYGIGASISAIVDGTVTGANVPTKLVFRTNNGSASAERITIDKTGALLSTQAILTTAGGIGYTTGAGGTVTQSTSKSSTVILNKLTGEVTMDAALLTAGSSATFSLANANVAATDHVIVSHVRGGTIGAYTVNAEALSTSVARITVRNITSSSLSESPVIKFTIIKSVIS